MVRQSQFEVNSLGSGKIPYSEEQVSLTPTFCKTFLNELQEFEGERNRRDYHTEELASEMARDNFRFEHLVLAQAELDGVMYRLNGQHTCAARLEFKDDRSLSKDVKLLTYRVKTVEDLRNLYATFDQHDRRSRGHIVIAQLVGFQGWTSVSKQMIKLVSQGFPLWKWEEPSERKKHDIRDIAFLLKTEQIEVSVKVGKFLTDKAGGKEGALVKRAPVVAAMLGTFAKSAEGAEEFWRSVIEGSGFLKNDPRNKLRSELLRYSVGNGGRTAAKTNLTPEQMLRLCIHAWNAWRSKRELVVLKATSKAPRPKFHQ